MSVSPEAPTTPSKPRRFSLVEILVVIAIIVVLIAILLPEAQWVADGTREFSVRVFVFDAESGEPV